MRWLSAAFDALCILAAAVLIVLCVNFYRSIDRNPKVPDMPRSPENYSSHEEDSQPAAEEQDSHQEIEYYNEAQVVTNAPVFQGIDPDSPGDSPDILIYHTHTSEKYANGVGSVVDVGKLLADLLEEYGYSVIHDTTINDTVFNQSYETAYKNVSAILEKYPTIYCVIDVHRDSATEDMVATYGGVNYAKLMLVVGTNVRLTNSQWQQNLSFAKALQINCAERVGNITKPIYLSVNRYNQHLLPNSVITEVGGEENTLSEALNTTYILAESIVDSLEGK